MPAIITLCSNSSVNVQVPTCNYDMAQLLVVNLEAPCTELQFCGYYTILSKCGVAHSPNKTRQQFMISPPQLQRCCVVVVVVVVIVVVVLLAAQIVTGLVQSLSSLQEWDPIVAAGSSDNSMLVVTYITVTRAYVNRRRPRRKGVNI